jgi:hypothetical protein
MDANRQMEIYKYANEKAKFLYNEGFRVNWNGRPTKQLRAIINNYCKKDGFNGVEIQLIVGRVSIIMYDLEREMYR